MRNNLKRHAMNKKEYKNTVNNSGNFERKYNDKNNIFF